LVPFRALGIRRQDQAFYLLALHGFRSEADRELLRTIAEHLDQSDSCPD
jgi:DnaJ-domain-containing protein 1